jgi:hypothetical protein
MKQRTLTTPVLPINQQILAIQLKRGGCRAGEGANVGEAEGLDFHVALATDILALVQVVPQSASSIRARWIPSFWKTGMWFVGSVAVLAFLFMVLPCCNCYVFDSCLHKFQVG